MNPILLLFFLIPANAEYVDDIGEKDCCPLVWKPLIDTPNGKVVPPDAIAIGNFNGETRYYSMLSGKVFGEDTGHIGILSQDSNKEVIYYTDKSNNLLYYREGCLHYSNDAKCISTVKDPVIVLTNPHGCSIGWWKRTEQLSKLPGYMNPLETSDIHIPRVGRFFFARFDQGNVVGGSIVNPDKLWVQHDADLVNHKGPGANVDILVINCRESIRRILNAQLFNITYDDKSLPGEKESLSLSSSTVINNNPFPQSFDVNVAAETVKSMQMTFSGWQFNSSQHTITSTLATDTSLDVGFDWKFLKSSFKGSIRTGYEEKWDNLMQKFASEGRMQAETKKTTYTFNQKVAVPAMSETKVTIITTPIKGNVPFKAKYRIKQTTQGIMSIPSIMDALKRLGITDLDKMKLENNEWVMNYDGNLAVETGYNTHVDIASKSLDKNSTQKVIHYKVYPFDH